MSSYPTKDAVANALTSYLTQGGASSPYPTNSAVATTLTRYLTSTVANNTYALKTNPTFTGNLSTTGVI